MAMALGVMGLHCMGGKGWQPAEEREPARGTEWLTPPTVRGYHTCLIVSCAQDLDLRL